MPFLQENSSFIQYQNNDCSLDASTAFEMEGHPNLNETRRAIQSCSATKAFWGVAMYAGLCVVFIIIMVALLVNQSEEWWIAGLVSVFFGGSAAFTYWWTMSGWNSDISIFNNKVREFTKIANQKKINHSSANYEDVKKEWLTRDDMQTSTQVQIDRNAIMQGDSRTSAAAMGVGLGAIASMFRKGGERLMGADIRGY